MRQHLALIENVEGPIVDLGFGNGKYSRNVKNIIQSSYHPARDFYLFDWFQQRPKGPAIDFANSITNDLGKEGLIVEGNVTETVPSKLPSEIALLHIDIVTVGLTYSLLESCADKMTHHGIIVVDYTDKEAPAAKEFESFAKELIKKKKALKFVDTKNSSYIVIQDIKVIENDKIRRQPRPKHLR